MDAFRRLDLGLLRAVLSAPDDPLPRAIAADWFREHGDDEVGEIIAAGRVPVDDLTGEAAALLTHVTMLPGSWDKRFTREVIAAVAEWWYSEVGGIAAPACVARADRLTPKQYLWVWRLLRRYRRQWAGKGKPPLLKHAELILAMPVRG